MKDSEMKAIKMAWEVELARLGVDMIWGEPNMFDLDDVMARSSLAEYASDGVWLHPCGGALGDESATPFCCDCPTCSQLKDFIEERLGGL